LFNRERTELVGNDLRDLLVRPEAWKALRDRLHVHGILENYALEFSTGGGDSFQGLLNSSCWRRSDGELEAYQHIIRDVTENIRREQQVEVVNRMLRHDIGNDIHSILGFANMIRPEVDGKYREYVDVVRRSGRRIADLTNLARLLMNALRDDSSGIDQSVDVVELPRAE
jgi:signal transduction histidine kinase